MQDYSILETKLDSIHGKDYGAYQSLLGSYEFPLFTLVIQQIPKDPYAPPHTGIYRIRVKRNDNRIVDFPLKSKLQKIAFSDFLARQFYDASSIHSKGMRGTGFSGVITVNQPGQVILERNSVVINDEIIEVRCFLGLAGKGRRIDARTAKTMLLDELPKIVEASLLSENTDQNALRQHIEVAEDANFLREQLDSHGLVAFIANDSVLPRESGTSDKPLVGENVLAFIAPDDLAYEFQLPNAGQIQGMGINKGITLIVGGGYHGKSTLLSALEVGVYNHIPGDGREYCVSNPLTTKIRAYSGRYVTNSDISSFINNLPFTQDTVEFSTENASGSTSQAANIVEAIEAGSRVLLMDEDTCATNFMIRDHKMQQLVKKSDEPITSFIDRIKPLYLENDISTILVLGGVGDYFDVADQVIQMINYEPTDVTLEAHKIAKDSPSKRLAEGDNSPFKPRARSPIASSISAQNAHGKFAIFAKEVHRLNFGRYVIDLTDLEQLVELSQTKALGFAIEYAKQYMDEERSLQDIVKHVVQDIDEHGLDILSERISGHYAAFRHLELAFAINRLRGFKASQLNS